MNVSFATFASFASQKIIPNCPKLEWFSYQERCQLDTRNTKKKRQSRVRIQFLAARATIISNETDEERTCLLGGGAGRSSDRSSYRVIERAKWVILPLDLGEYRFCRRGG